MIDLDYLDRLCNSEQMDAEAFRTAILTLRALMATASTTINACNEIARMAVDEALPDDDMTAELVIKAINARFSLLKPLVTPTRSDA
jgi:hypothetical protein